ncbi:transposase [Salmonella enterica subsp. enterica serovar Gallinarum]|nr:transposase [Salmonella enterica subsp. enterica serovar Gallinarum]MBE5574218.1 transposase [Salmonella enterica subsp. enterica serovar Gallinarum]MBE5578388.1 transposase [Salmonella enterica subsp. enterica serovar Gallinarum]
MMIPLPSGTKIWLVAKVQTVLKDDPMSGHLFIFRGHSGSQVKLLWSTGDSWSAGASLGRQPAIAKCS